MDVIDELKDAVSSEKLVIGTKKTLLALKKGMLKSVFVSSNCPSVVKGDIDYYSSHTGAGVLMLDIPNTEVAVLCKKPYRISVLGITK